MEQYSRALIGTSEAIEAEWSYKPLDGSKFCFAEMVDDEVIAVSGYDTLEAAKMLLLTMVLKLLSLNIMVLSVNNSLTL